MQLNWKSHPRPIIALSPMADMTDSAFCRVVKQVTDASDIVRRASDRPENTHSANVKRQTAGELDPNHPTNDEQQTVSDFPIVFREMVSAEAVVRGNNKTLDMTDIHPAERPLVQQIFGSDPATMTEAARIIEAQHHPEGFDVNMGCPVYKIVHNFNGAALMKEPELAAKIVKSMKAAITVPLSIKIRLGWSDPGECLTFTKVLEDAGADLITIHGRTKAQGYAGVADWDMIRRAKQAVSIPVLANGDIHKAELMPKALEISGCDGVLIARGALGNPWIFRDYALMMNNQTPPPISLEERLKVVTLHLHLHLEQYGPKSLNTFRKHLSWYFKGLPNFKQYKEPLMKATEPEEILKIFNSMLV